MSFNWPKVPSHANAKPTWRSPAPEKTPYGIPYRTCSYCGSIHPEDMLLYLSLGATLEKADQKYGWPHKIYVGQIPNPQAGNRVQLGGISGPDAQEEPIYGDAPKHVTAKWYNSHLRELGKDEFKNVAAAILGMTGIEFLRSSGGLKYKMVE